MQPMRSGVGASIDPESSSAPPRIAASNDDFPQPLAPTRPMRSPSDAVTFTSRYKVRVPRSRRSPDRRSIGGLAGLEQARLYGIGSFKWTGQAADDSKTPVG